MELKIAVKGIIKRGDGKILIVRRSKNDNFAPGIWETIGGSVKTKTDPRLELKREILEEVNLKVEVREAFNTFTFTNDKGEFKIGITYICEYLEGEVELSKEHDDFLWIDPRNIKNYHSIPAIYQEIVTYANKYCGGFEKFNMSQKALLIRNDKCFIAEVNKDPGIWDLPGGRIDKGEDSDTAFQRELKEELGISNFKNLGTYDCQNCITRAGMPIVITTSLIESTEDLTISSEHSKGIWISENEIFEYNYILEAMQEMIRKGFKYKRFISQQKD